MAPPASHEIRERSPQLAPRQRSAFILFDGVKTVEQVLLATAGIGMTLADVEHMLAQGFIAAPPADTPAALAAAEQRTPRQRYAAAYPLATRLTASLGLRGFTLNLAVEAAQGYEDLLALLPRIQDAVGQAACAELAQALTP